MIQRFEHGGNVYQPSPKGKAWLDFSANINPLGLSSAVRQALAAHLDQVVHYPDPAGTALRQALEQAYGVPGGSIVLGNGAAELFYLYMHTFRPQRVLLPVPSFSEYERAARAAGAVVDYGYLKEDDGFAFPWKELRQACGQSDCIVLGNPNNPTGLLTPKGLVKKGMERCAEVGAWLLVDECFHDFLCEPERSVLTDQLADNPHLILLRSFTKMYAMPGIRLGYCLSSDRQLVDRLYEAGAPWSVSGIAQACGIAAAQDTDFPRKTRAYVAIQRAAIQRGLEDLGLHVIDGQVNYLLFRNLCIPDLQRRLHDRGILIRSCANYHGLDDTWFRIAVRNETENFVLLHTLRQLKEESAWQR